MEINNIKSYKMSQKYNKMFKYLVNLVNHIIKISKYISQVVNI